MTKGYCGTTKEHCAAPDCQINFGPGCDANKTPYGASTKDDARPQLGSIEYGGWGIRECLKPKTVAITYDDGPYIYTEQVMAQFEARGAHATFFITGNNIGKGAIDENWRDVITKMDANGHQIASHTWSHQNLDEITSEQRYDQMVKNEMALRNILGKYPTYMRPPYSACITQPCMDDMKKLGYVITSFDLDTDDYNQLTPEKIQVAKDNFKAGMVKAGPEGDALVIGHDIHELTAMNLTAYMLDYVYSNGYTAVTVGECMNDDKKNWYRDSAAGPRPSATPSSSVPVPTPTGPTSTDGQCGTANGGQSCIGFTGPDGISECCSSAGWCGRSSDHCGTGCNAAFGKCGTQPSISATPSVSASTTSAAPIPTVSLPTSTDGGCGATAGKTCKGFTLNGVQAECCSQYNFCGNTEDYCGPTCNPLYGNCGSSGSSSSASASVSKTSSAAASSSASVSKSASLSASASVSKSSSAAVSSSASKSDVESASSTPVHSSSASASASASKSDVKSTSSAPVHSSSASASASKSDVKSATSTPAHSSSPSASASKSDIKSASSTPVQSSSASASASKSDVKSASSTPAVTSTVTPIEHPSSTPIKTSSEKPSETPLASSSVYPDATSTKAYPTTFGTVVKPSSTPCDDDKPTPTPTPTGPPVSKDGKCGKDNGGQTCAGYKNPFGQSIECCCKESGRCSTDPWACGVGCDAKFGNCNKSGY